MNKLGLCILSNKNPMKKYLSPFLLLLFFACSPSDDDTTRFDLADRLGVPVSASPFGGAGLFYENIAYGSGTRQQLDILLPHAGPLEGIVLFFHGGGFTSGDKRDSYDELLASTMQTILDNNVALVSANYTLLTTPGNRGVISALDDGADAIAYVQDHLSDLGVPTNKLILAGASAGAGIAQWNGFREATNAQVQGVVALAAQSSYDLYEWEEVFPGFTLDGLRQSNPFLQSLFLQFYGGSEPTQQELDAVDYRSFMDGQDPPLYVLNTAGDQLINAQGQLDFDVLYHSFRHADYLRAKAIEVALEFSGIYQESPDAFVLRQLR